MLTGCITEEMSLPRTGLTNQQKEWNVGKLRNV